MSEDRLVVKLTVDQALMFFELAREHNLNTPEERQALLNAMVTAGACESAYVTKRTEEEVFQDLSKHFNVAKLDVNGTQEEPS